MEDIVYLISISNKVEVKMASILELIPWYGEKAPGDIDPPGEKILKYRVGFTSDPWCQIECELANGSKLILVFLTDQYYNWHIEEFNVPQTYAHEKSYGYDYKTYFHERYYEAFLDLFRNEKPLYFVIRTNTDLASQPKTAFIISDVEPVGSEESLEVPFPGTIILRVGGLPYNLSPLIISKLSQAGIAKGEAQKLVTKLSEACRTGIASKQLAKVVERVPKNPKLKTQLLRNPTEAVRKMSSGR
jgi:hypothetical protein